MSEPVPDLDAVAADAIARKLTPRTAAMRAKLPVAVVREAMRRAAYECKRQS